MLDLTAPKTAVDAEAALQQIAARHMPQLEASLAAYLTEAEKQTQRFVQSLGYAEGAWYRPVHNIVVPAAMLRIIQHEGCSRDLLLAAQLHDVGSSIIRVAGAAGGAAWETSDNRVDHMKRGADVARGHLYTMQAVCGLELDPNRVEKLATIVEIHDNPYLGTDLGDDEATLVRSADRTFVVSALSFYKDLIVYAADTQYAALRADLGLNNSPRDLLSCRLAFFYPDPSHLPAGWNNADLPLRTEHARFNEGGRCEPCYTEVEKEIVGQIFLRRAVELPAVEQASTVEMFAKVIERAFLEEVNAILQQANQRP